jgi:putative transposase
MVRAGVVAHPSAWPHGAFQEIQAPRSRAGIVDHGALLSLGGFRDLAALQKAHRKWVAAALARPLTREPAWSEALAVGGNAFVEQVKDALGVRGRYREIVGEGDTYALREAEVDYLA